MLMLTKDHERRNKMDYYQPIDSLVENIKGTTGFLGKYLFLSQMILYLTLVVGAIIVVRSLIG
jgi:hypothetical protein